VTRPALVLLLAGLRALRRTTVWWLIAIALLVGATVGFWPAFKGASGISQAIDNLPGAVIDAFGLRDFGTPAGFLRGNLYELFLPLLFSIAGVAFINGQTAADEAAGRLELFLSQPIRRRSLFATRAVGCLIVLAVIVVATIAVQLAADGAVGLVIDGGFVAATAVLCGLLAAVHASLAYLVACLRPQPSMVLGIGVGVTIAGYVVAALFPISSVLKPWRSISPWDWALGGNPLESTSDPWRFAALAGASVALLILGTLVVTRRDVASA